MKVMHAHPIFGGLVADLVLRAVNQTTSDAPAGHPGCRAVRPMVPASGALSR